MKEIKEAERFSRELDKILAGKAVAADLDPEMAKDLAFAAKLSALDHSAESRMKAPTKLKILAKAQENRFLRMLRHAGVRPEVLAYCLLALLVGPLAINRLASDADKPRSSAAGGLTPLSRLGGGGMNLVRSSPGFRDIAGPRGNGPSGMDSTGRASGGSGGSKSVGESLSFEQAKERMRENLRLESEQRLNPSFDGVKLAGQNAGDAFSRADGGPAGKGLGVMKYGYLSSGLGSNDKAPMGLPPAPPAPGDREAYGRTVENAFQKATEHPLSTFSIDVDAASYSNARRFLRENRMPPEDAVRVEEFINYFRYEYPEPQGEHPFSITTEVAACPWNGEHKLVRVGIKGKSMAAGKLPTNNLVFLIDTSGSMAGADRLELVKQGLRMLVAQLRKEDRISIVAYAGSAGLVLPATSGANKGEILAALDRLQSGGSTAGGEGINLAYSVAAQSFIQEGNNRVILATDGDFNVGVTSDGELTRLIEEKREKGVFLTVLGVGSGNLQDHKMEQLADKGNGNYAYLDDVMEARKVLVKEMSGTLVTIAKDVKIQVEFNPARVSSYKLVGYENRMLAAQDFNNDKKDAGELGAGHTVTALYEVVPAGAADEGGPSIDPLKYQKNPAPEPAPAISRELLTVKFRYKKPNENVSRLITRPLADEERAWSQASSDFKFAASAAGFAMMLRHSALKGSLTYDKVRAMAQEGLGKDEDGYRSEMVRLIAKAKLLDTKER